MSIITLDYDDVSKDFVIDDAEDLLMNVLPDKAEMHVSESSLNHYHVEFRTVEELTFAECVSIARKSKCSKDYIDRVEKIGYFAIRTTRKSDGTPAPREILSIINGGGQK
jgi:hypothetical protein